MSNFAVGGAGPLGSVNLSSVDIETALLAVQTQRSQLLQSSLRTQLEGVDAKNKQMAEMNNKITADQSAATSLEGQNLKLAEQKAADEAALTGLESTVGAKSAELDAKIAGMKELQNRLAASKCPDPEGFYGLAWGQGDNGPLSYQTLEQVKALGLTIPTGADAPRNVDGNHTMDAKGKVVQQWINEIGGKINEAMAEKQQLADQVTTLKTKIETTGKTIDENAAKVKTLRDGVDAMKRDIDALSNSQQMDMLRLQSMSNKRNEAFDVMTNFIKKMQDSRSSIIGNMR